MNSLKSLIIFLLFTLSISKIIRFKVPENIKKAKISVKENKEFELRLDGNPTTGYSWSILNADKLNDYDIKPLNIDGDYYQEETYEKLLGHGGVFSFKFNSGSASDKNKVIKFVYKRPWEDSEYDEYVTIYVSVKK